MADHATYTVKLALAARCSTCAEARGVLPSGACPVCSTPLPAEAVKALREAVARRRQTFKGRLRRLEQEMHSVTDGPLTFLTRGVPRGEDAHLAEVLRPAMKSLSERNETVTRLLATGTWDPNEAGCIERFNELVGTIDAGLDFVTSLCEMMPPVEWRAVHRELARAAAQMTRSHVFMTMVIIAPDADAAAGPREECERASAISGEHAKRVARLIDLISQSPSDGPFQMDGSLDFAALAWTSVGLTTTSIAVGAKLVRDAFGRIPVLQSLFFGL